MTNYLEAAADQLKQAIEASEKDNAGYLGILAAERVKHAKVYALLGAIDKGLMPEAVAEEIYGQLRSKTNR